MGEIGIHLKSSIIAMFNGVLKPCNIGCAQAQLTWPMEHFYPGILVMYLVGEFSCAIWRVIVNDQHIRLWHIRKDLFEQRTQILNFVIRRCNK